MSEKVSPLRQPAAPVSAAAFTHEVAGLIVEALNLDVAPADIDPAQDNERIFGSLRQLVDYITAHRTK